MGNIFAGLGDVPDDKRNSKADILQAYEENHAKLLRDYNNEIAEMEKLLNNLRNERIEFYQETLPRIRAKMREDGASEAAIEEWIEILKDNIENSFSMSESIIKSFWIDTKEEFSRKINEIIERI